MAFLDELKKITRPYDEDEDFFMNDDEQDEFDDFREEPVKPAKPAPAEFDEPAPAKNVFKRDREPVRPAAAPAVERSKMELVLANPETFEEAAGIADNLRKKHAVLLNIEKADREVQRRLIDFLSGVAYALGGKIKRVSAQAYILTPTNVDLVGDSIEDFESSGFYF